MDVLLCLINNHIVSPFSIMGNTQSSSICSNAMLVDQMIDDKDKNALRVAKMCTCHDCVGIMALCIAIEDPSKTGYHKALPHAIRSAGCNSVSGMYAMSFILTRQITSI